MLVKSLATGLVLFRCLSFATADLFGEAQAKKTQGRTGEDRIVRATKKISFDNENKKV